MERSSAAGNCLWVKLLRTNEKRYPVTFQKKKYKVLMRLFGVSVV